MSDTAAKTTVDRRLSPILTKGNVIGSEKNRKYNGGANKVEDSSFEFVCDNSLIIGGSGGRHSAYTDMEAKQHNIFHDNKVRSGNLIIPASTFLIRKHNEM